MNIVVLDRMALGDDIDMSIFEKLGKLTIYERTATEEVVDRLRDADALLTNKVVIGKAEMDRLPKLRYIGINATGTNNIDLAYAAKKNIAVTNVKSYSTDSVVQHTFALLFYVYEKLRHYDDFVKQGKYSDYGCFTYFGERFAQLSGKTWGISHEEMHSEVEYIVAHGIASRVGGKRVVIGSAHFIFEDEGCTIPAGEQARFDGLDPQYSHLYLAASGVLAGVICIADPLRPEAAQVLRQLQKLGITQTVMMTGDSDRTARAIAAQVGVDRCFAEVLPEDKAAFVRDAKAEGHTVVMIGDGINDSPALSAADIGIAIHSGAAIAREIADVTIRADSLEELVTLKAIANALQKRVGSNYRFVLSFNSALILLGALGILPPATSAMLHNLSTLGISLRSMTDLLEQKPSL